MYATRQTRAQERGYSTVFTEGDCIGLYVVKDGTLEVKNLCLTLQEASGRCLPALLSFSTHPIRVIMPIIPTRTIAI